MSDQSNTNQPPAESGLIGSHVEYMKGVGEAAIGSITGSHAWMTSGQQDKAHAQAAMKKAAEHRDPKQHGYGRAEEIAGKAFGCQGMQQEGAASSPKKD